MSSSYLFSNSSSPSFSSLSLPPSVPSLSLLSLLSLSAAVPKPLGRGMLLRKLYESQSKTQAEIPKQTTPSSPPTDEMSQLQVKMTAPFTAEMSKPSPTGLQSRQAPSPRSPSSPASQSTLKAGQHSPPGSAPSSHSPFTLLGDGEIRQGISGSR